MKKVILAMSGGVDSSVAALTLLDAGYDVIGVNMTIYKGESLPAAKKGCYGRENLQDKLAAAEICKKLGIPFFNFDCSEEYKKTVIKYFKEEYLNGKTPNPCVCCNSFIKFDLLPRKAREAGLMFDFFATGHYARIVLKKNGRYYLKQAKDIEKDQTYFLFRLSQNVLAKTIFPLGDKTKKEVREIAKKYLGEIYEKPDSQDFYGGNYNDILEMPPKKGKIIHTNGEILGTHNGFWNYTVGQRKGLGISYHVPLYVKSLDPENNLVIVDEENAVMNTECQAKDFFFFPYDDKPLQAKIRSSQTLKNVTSLTVKNDTSLIFFEKPLKAITPGQNIVIYQNKLLVGGGTIISNS